VNVAQILVNVGEDGTAPEAGPRTQLQIVRERPPLATGNPHLHPVKPAWGARTPLLLFPETMIGRAA
jgi:hypothetical protein